MQMKNSKPEILAPCGNAEMLTAAVRSGADAVYFGAKAFSARRNAENFDTEQLKGAVKYCKIRGVKTYLTLNILIKDSEILNALNLAKQAYLAGIDGVILQDLGLADLIRKNIPELPLHASTQMSVHSPSALEELAEMGFKRVVVSREMSKEQLRSLCKRAKELNIEVETFVHGALCMCLSGQCLLSSFLGSRSGNRGLCAGPCRLPFAAKNGTGYDLSLKDLSLIEHINELSDMGVVSLKIEGRMKRPEYVAAAVHACRKAVDNGFAEKQSLEVLKNIFSRSGFTDGYFENKLGKNMFGIRTKEDVLSSNDTISSLHNLYRNERQSVQITGEVNILRDKDITLTLSDGINTVSISASKAGQAISKPTDRESIEKSLSKLGGTPYTMTTLSVNLDDGLFVPASALNELRRHAVDELSLARSEIKRQPCNTNLPEIDSNRLKIQQTYARFEAAEQIPDNLSGISAIIFPLEKDGFNTLPKDKTLIADIPRGIVSETAILNRLMLFKDYGFTAALCGNLALIPLIKQVGLDIIFDTGMNIYNSYSANKAKEMGAVKTMLSSEILLDDANKLNSPIPKGIISYGKIPLMIFKNCPLKNGVDCKECDKKGFLTDRKNTRFPVRCRMGFSEMLNSVPLWLADRKSELSELDFTVLYFTDETKEEAASVINSYKNSEESQKKYTRGLFYRGAM